LSHKLPTGKLGVKIEARSLTLPDTHPRSDIRRALPSLDRLLRLAPGSALVASYGRERVAGTLRDVLHACREGLDAGVPNIDLADAALLARCEARLAELEQPSLRPVMNLSGTVLHTNLGRAVLPDVAVRAAAAAMSSPTNLEFDLESGGRGERDDHVESLLCRLTGAEAATVVNNNAAAVLLALATVAPRREVIVSRGELVEIGGAFRIPDVMTRAGCRLVEVGTTNRTHLRDYETAIGERTGALMKVHASNYAIKGFTAEVPQNELGALARSRGVPLLVDLGSGSLIDLRQFDLPREPTPMEAIADGAAAVMFSGDKLLGGPQCGIVVGSRELITRMRRNPLKRALRLDKIMLAALEATLRIYLDPERARNELPTLRFLTRGHGDIVAQAERLRGPVEAALGSHAVVSVVACMSQIGSGSLPVDLLPSGGIALRPPGSAKGLSAGQLAESFRRLPVPVIGRVHKGVFTLDLRCMQDEAAFVAQLPRIATLLPTA
jgi:L-seryl-tRNA(Ser) seleniumtransferase